MPYTVIGGWDRTLEIPGDGLDNAMIDEVEEYVDQVVDKDFELIRTSLKQQLKIDVPQKVMLVKNYRVVGRHQHPMVARHQALGEQLKAVGKTPATHL